MYYKIISFLKPFVNFILGNLRPEGCEDGWHHFKDFCYLAVDAHIHFDSAKAICLLKGSTLTSLWGQDEIAFVTRLLQNASVCFSFLNN
jgi:hypothetical protein